MCCYSFSKAARPQKHQAGHLEYKEIRSSSRLWKQMSHKYETRLCKKVALRYCRTLPRSDQDQTKAVRLLATCMLIFLSRRKQLPHKTHFTLCCACCSLAEAERATSLVTHVSLQPSVTNEEGGWAEVKQAPKI